MTLIVHRSPLGIVARALTTGELRWEQYDPYSLDHIEHLGKFASTLRACTS